MSNTRDATHKIEKSVTANKRDKALKILMCIMNIIIQDKSVMKKAGRRKVFIYSV